MKTEQQKTVEALRDKINKRFGDGTVEIASKHTGAEMVRMRTGVLSFDINSGGGMVLNTMNVFYGLESHGKSTLTLHTIAERQRRGEVCALITSEPVDKVHIETCGVDLDSLLLTETRSSEECVDLVNTLASSRQVSYIVVDSIYFLVPTRVMEKQAQQHMGVEAYFINLLCRVFGAATHIRSGQKPWCTMTLIAHGALPINEKYPVMYPKGGKAKDFLAVQIVEVRKGVKLNADGEEIKEVDDAVGHQIRFAFRKNKTAPPYKAAEVNYYVGQTNFGCGRGDIDHVLDTVVCGVKYGVFEMHGAWIKYGGKDYQGQQKFSNYLRALPPDEFEKIRQEIYERGVQVESNRQIADGDFEDKGVDGGSSGVVDEEKPKGKKPAKGKADRA